MQKLEKDRVKMDLMAEQKASGFFFVFCFCFLFFVFCFLFFVFCFYFILFFNIFY